MCARVDNASSDSEWRRTAKTSGTEWLEAKAHLHVRSWRWYECQVVILFTKSQWPVPTRPEPDFICLSLNVSAQASVSQKGHSWLAHFISFPIRRLTHWKDARSLAQCLVRLRHWDIQNDRKSSVPMSAYEYLEQIHSECILVSFSPSCLVAVRYPTWYILSFISVVEKKKTIHCFFLLGSWAKWKQCLFEELPLAATLTDVGPCPWVERWGDSTLSCSLAHPPPSVPLRSQVWILSASYL